MADYLSAAADLFSGAGTFAGDFFSSEGAEKSAGAYREAASLARENAAYSEQSTRLKLYQEGRAIRKSIGGQLSDQASNGFAESGSVIDILKDSASQGSLLLATTSIQGAINKESYLAQASAYEGEADAAEMAAKGDMAAGAAGLAGGAIKAAGALFGL